MVKIYTCSAGDLGSISGSGRSPGEGNGYPFQYSWLENSLDRGAWWATVHGVTQSWTWLSYSNFHFHSNIVNHDDSILIYKVLRDLFHRFFSWILLSEVDFITLNIIEIRETWRLNNSRKSHKFNCFKQINILFTKFSIILSFTDSVFVKALQLPI